MRVRLRKSVDGNGISVTLKNKAISQRVNKMGFTVFLYNGDHTWDEALTLYGERNIIEKISPVLKRYLEAMPMNVQSTETMKGFVFVTFLALIFRFRLIKMLRDACLGREWSVDKLILEMEKLSTLEMGNGEMITGEVTKKQRELMEALRLTCVLKRGSSGLELHLSTWSHHPEIRGITRSIKVGHMIYQ